MRIQGVEILTDAGCVLRGIFGRRFVVVVIIELIRIFQVVLELEFQLALDRFLVLHMEMLFRLILERVAHCLRSHQGDLLKYRLLNQLYLQFVYLLGIELKLQKQQLVDVCGNWLQHVRSQQLTAELIAHKDKHVLVLLRVQTEVLAEHPL